MSKVLLETKNLCKYFNRPNGLLHAVDDVNISIYEGKALGVVGESGCGKSTLGRTILNLLPPTSGEVWFDGENVTRIKKKKRTDFYRKAQIIFQDPYSSINPRMSVQDIIAEPMIVTKRFSSRSQILKETDRLMEIVGLASRLATAYPHELDGGRRQRIGIARALSLNPRFIVCDEPVSALDVSIQAQILNLLMDIQRDMGLTYMFITHDLSVVKHISDNIAVMYLGQCVETAPSSELFKNPCHPYTKGLLAFILIPSLSVRNRKMQTMRGEVISPINPKPGCRFAKRCPYFSEACEQSQTLKEIADGHMVACHYAFEQLT